MQVSTSAILFLAISISCPYSAHRRRRLAGARKKIKLAQSSGAFCCFWCSLSF